MSEKYFYNRTLRNIVAAMQTLFNNITVKRYDDKGNVSKEWKVPCKFGPLHKFYMRRMEDGSYKRYYIQLPAMAIAVTSLAFDQDRSMSQKERRYLLAEKDNSEYALENFMSDMPPAPWNVGFKLEIRTESFEDWCQIVEQIIPWFQPSVYLRVKEFNMVNMERDIQVTLDGLSPEFMEEQGNEDVRSINGSLDFTAKALFYKPITDAAIIKKIKATYGIEPFNDMFDYSTMKPEEYQKMTSAVQQEEFGTSAITPEQTSGITISGSTTINDLDTKNIYGYDVYPEETKALNKANDERWLKE